MVCRKCGKENDQDAAFCKYCGEKLAQEMICPSCNKINDENALFCKYCGTKLSTDVSEKTEEEAVCQSTPVEKKPKNALKTVKWVFGLVFFILALVVMTLNFGATFSNFVKCDIPRSIMGSIGTDMDINSEINLFSVIESIDNYEKVVDTPIAVFYIFGSSGLFDSIVQLVAIATAMIGTFVVLLVGAIKAIYTGVVKKEFINLKKYVALSVGFLLSGALFVLLFGGSLKSSVMGITVEISTKLGGFVATSIWLSISFIFLYIIYDFVMVIIEKKGRSEIYKSVFRFIETALLVTLLMIVAGTLIKLKVTVEDYIMSSATSSMALNSGGWFSFLNQDIYTINSQAPFFFKFDTVSDVYVPSIISLIISMGLIVALAVFFVKRVSIKDSKYKGSLVTGIVLSCLSLVHLIVAIIVNKQVMGNELLKESLLDGATNGKISVGGSVIALLVITLILLAEEIVGFLLIQNKPKSEEVCHE